MTPRERYVAAVAAQEADDARADRRLNILFYVVMVGFLVAGVIGLVSNPTVGGIG